MTAQHPRLVGLTGRKRSGKGAVAGFLSRPPPDDNHASEAGVSDDLVDLEVINDGTL